MKLSQTAQQHVEPELPPVPVRCPQCRAAHRSRANVLVGSDRVAAGPGLSGKKGNVFGFTIARGKIVAIDVVADPARIGELDLVILND